MRILPRQLRCMMENRNPIQMTDSNTIVVFINGIRLLERFFRDDFLCRFTIEVTIQPRGGRRVTIKDSGSCGSKEGSCQLQYERENYLRDDIEDSVRSICHLHKD